MIIGSGYIQTRTISDVSMSRVGLYGLTARSILGTIMLTMVLIGPTGTRHPTQKRADRRQSEGHWERPG